MSRARSLKPSFFKNETLAELDPLVRLFFQGLWCEADRRGIVEDRPKRLKAEIMPYDDINPDDALAKLADLGFIERYEMTGTRCIFIVNFGKHQNPHRDEKASTLPAPCKHSVDTVPELNGHDTNTALTLNPEPITLNLEPGTPPVVPPSPPAPPAPPPPKEPKPRTDKQKAADELYERKMVIVAAYFRGLAIEEDTLPWTQRKGSALGALTSAVLNSPECVPEIVEPLTRYTAAAFQWRHGKKTPGLNEVLMAFAEWDQAGRPDGIPSKPTTARASPPPNNLNGVFDRLRRERGEPPRDDPDVIEAGFKLGARA